MDLLFKNNFFVEAQSKKTRIDSIDKGDTPLLWTHTPSNWRSRVYQAVFCKKNDIPL